jgi:hypothetical protein
MSYPRIDGDPPADSTPIDGLGNLIDAVKQGRAAEEQLARSLTSIGRKLPEEIVRIPGTTRHIDLVKLGLLIVIAVKILFFG